MKSAYGLAARVGDWAYQGLLRVSLGAMRASRSRDARALRLLGRGLNMLTRRALSAAPEQVRVSLPYCGQTLRMHPSHALPQILAWHPDFGRNLLTVIDSLAVDAPCIIDVGANIGDTALMVLDHAPAARLLCVEGDPAFCAELEQNTAGTGRVEIAPVLLGDDVSAHGRVVRHHGGSGAVEVGDAGTPVQTLDQVLGQFPSFAAPDLLKIDTDGYDPKVLRGAQHLLSTIQPVVFYEWHPYFYDRAGEDQCAHVESLVACGYETFFVYDNLGRLLVRLERPERHELLSLAAYSRGRRAVDDLHFDVAAFTPRRAAAAERLWRSEMGMAGRID